VTSTYRSTRQLVGRLLCQRGGATRIEYDVLDGEPLEIRGLGDEAAFVPQPFPAHPPAPGVVGPRKGIAPYALWAAVQLAASTAGGGQSVLISVIEGISNFASWCVSLLEEDWEDVNLPQFFTEPPEGSSDKQLLDIALTVTSDLFGPDSREQRLLRFGIALHHGRMPGRLARILVELVERRILRIVIATSTLTQGVNLPFETILVPGLTRQSGRVTVQEFTNLIGRAGRPGVATEGQALVLLREDLPAWQRRRDLADYRATLAEWTGGQSPSGPNRGPLAALITLIRGRWISAYPATADAFEAWLEATAVGGEGDEDDPLLRSLDTLDGVLLAALEESSGDVEEALRRVWNETFTRYATVEEARLEQAFLARGNAVARRFGDAEERRRIYRTNLPPRAAETLYAAAPALIEHLRQGADYWRWGADRRYSYVEHTIEIVTQVRPFTISQRVRQSQATWRDVLLWWLNPSAAVRTPSVAQVGNWHDFISQSFTYRFAWGLSAMTLLNVPAVGATNTDVWADAGIPPAGLWMKELVTWGTLDPVAAYILSRRVADARPEAEALALDYYGQVDTQATEDPLTPTAIQEWAASLEVARVRDLRPSVPARIGVRLNPRVADASQLGRTRVVPLTRTDHIDWADPAGYVLATSERPDDWTQDAPRRLDFMLNPTDAVVESSAYM
jgi:hypothetical protein